MRVSCVQTLSNENIIENLDKIKKLIYRAINQKADFILTPEVCSIFSLNKNFLKNKKTNKKLIFFLNEIKNIAKKNKKWILIGSTIFQKGNKLYNRSILINSNGKIHQYYDKIHMFNVYLSKKEKFFESNTFSSGKKIKVAKTPWGTLGMSICYDLRFPKMFRYMAKKGAIFLSVPSNFLNTTGKKHWHTLLKARAIENFSYVFAPAQYGKHKNGVKVFGNSLIISPNGEIIKELKKGEGIITAKIDLNLPKRLRKRIPSLRGN